MTLTPAQEQELAAIRQRHTDRLAWLDQTGTRGHLHQINEDLDSLLNIIAPPLQTFAAKPAKTLVLRKLPLRKP